MTNKFSGALTREQVVGELAGAASTCWEKLDQAGVFDSELAEYYVGEALIRLHELDSVATTETTEVVFEELPLITKDETIRLECLALACSTSVRGASREQPIIERARYFEQYVRNGAFEHAQA